MDVALSESATGMHVAASAWALQRIVGGWPAVASVTVKHKAAELLKLMGGVNALSDPALASFYDPYHRCYLQIIFFIPEFLNPRFLSLIHFTMEQLLDKAVIMPEVQEFLVPADSHS